MTKHKDSKRYVPLIVIQIYMQMIVFEVSASMRVPMCICSKHACTLCGMRTYTCTYIYTCTYACTCARRIVTALSYK